MPLPLIVAALTGGVLAGTASRKYVKTRQEEAIRAATKEAKDRIRGEIEHALEILEQHERKSMHQFFWAVACAVLLILTLATYATLAPWVALGFWFLSAYLIAESVALIVFNPVVKKYFKLVRANWAENGYKFRKSAVTEAIHLAVINDIRERLESEAALSEIKGKVDAKIDKLNSIDAVFYNVFGDSRDNIARKIQDEVLKEVNLGNVTRGITQVVLKILGAMALYVIVSASIRGVVLELAGNAVALLAALIVFIGCFLFHRHRMKTVEFL